MAFPKDFPSDADLARVKEEHEYFRFYASDVHDHEGQSDRGKFRLKEFFSNDKKKALLLDRALNVAPLIVDIGTSFLFGEPFKVEIDGEEGTTNPNEAKIVDIMERTNLRRVLAQSTKLYESVGHAHIELSRDKDGKVIIDETPYSYWFPNWSGVPLGRDTDNPRIVAYLTDVKESGEEQKYIYIKDYYMDGEEAVIAKSLWEDSGKKLGQQVPLNTLKIPLGDKVTGDPNTAMIVIERTGLDELPVVTIDRPKTVMDRFGPSIYRNVRTLLFELNDRLTQVSLQFLKHLNAKLQVPETTVTRDKDGKVQRVDLEVILAKQGDPETKYITNDNPLVEQAFEHIDKILRQIAKLTQTPDSFLIEDEKGGVEKAEALRVRMMAFLKRIRLNESVYEPAIKKILKLALKIESVKDADKLALKITFDQGIPKDWQYDGDVWGNALANGIASKETSVRRFQAIEGDELQAELDRIESDQEAMMQSQIDLKTAMPPDDEGGGEE